jgi:two-component system chemotaxis response regulator CheY
MTAPRALVIDDEPLVLEVFAQALERAGYDVVTARNGREGLHEFRRGRVDLIVTDLFMPEVDGLEFLRALRAVNATVPVIAISGGGELERADLLPLARALGAAHVLAKPVELADLVAAARALVPTPPA